MDNGTGSAGWPCFVASIQPQKQRVASQRSKVTVSPAALSVLLVKRLTATRIPGLSPAAPPLCITSIRSVVAEAPVPRTERSSSPSSSSSPPRASHSPRGNGAHVSVSKMLPPPRCFIPACISSSRCIMSLPRASAASILASMPPTLSLTPWSVSSTASSFWSMKGSRSARSNTIATSRRVSTETIMSSASSASCRPRSARSIPSLNSALVQNALTFPNQPPARSRRVSTSVTSFCSAVSAAVIR
mmetsp:Transcript_31507/g.74884  ORF Transcript_31507/g.74884 Transcript_31507/m.74884 type:complete len:245 (+) Transcript_31507:234-968(+)